MSCSEKITTLHSCTFEDFQWYRSVVAFNILFLLGLIFPMLLILCVNICIVLVYLIGLLLNVFYIILIIFAILVYSSLPLLQPN